MFFWSAKSFRPPASASAWRIVIGACRFTAPGWFTSPITYAIAAVASTTITVTTGFVMYSFSDLVIVSRSSIGVWLVASRSPTSGSVILPSGRIWTDCESCASL